MNKSIWRALLAALLFGVSAPIAKALAGNVPPQFLAGVLYLGSGGGLLLFRRFRRGSPARSEPPVSRAEFPFLAGAIAAGGVLAPILLIFGLQRTSAAPAALLLNLEAVFTALIAWLIFHENLGSRVVAGMLAIVAGGVLLSWSNEPWAAGALTGPLAVAGACALWAIDNNLTQKISAGDPVQIASWKGLIGGTINLTFSWLAGRSPALGGFIVAALATGFIGYGISLVLYIRALRDLGTARAGNYFSFSPFVGATVGLVLFHEPLTARFAGAGLLMAIGIWLHLSEDHEHFHIHEPMAHEHLHVHDEHHQHEHEPGDPAGEPHSHAHRHDGLKHSHPHYPDIHHRHSH